VSVTAVVQARMRSTRLSGKVLRPLGDTTVLGQVVRRLQACTTLARIVVATTVEPGDDAIAGEGRRLGALVTRGDERDVLGRYLLAFDQHDGDVGVRITSDCPLIDPDLVDRCVQRFLRGNPPPDYLSNTLRRTYPRGYDIEVFRVEALRTAGREATGESEREHVTPFLYRHPDRFRLESVERADPHGSAAWRLTLDTPEDWDVIRAVFDRLAPANRLFGLEDVERLLAREPELLTPNRGIRQKPH
jgi:spore coat polysaccharide biosynthesis protein SpsF